MEITGNMASQIVKETMGAQLVKQTLGLANKTGTSNQASFDMQTKVLGAAMSGVAAEAAVEIAKADTGIGINIDIVI